jgi:hypothetical protein
LKSNRLGKTGEQLQLLGIEGRNNGITLKKKERLRVDAKRSHSHIPGQCNHQHVEDERNSPIRGDPDKLCNIEEMSESSCSIVNENGGIPKMIQPCIFEMKEKETVDGKDVKVIKFNSK